LVKVRKVLYFLSHFE